MGLIAKDDLFGEIWVNFQLLQNPISEHTALSMVVYLKFLGQLNFIGVQNPSFDAKFAKLKSQEGQVLVNDEKLTRLGFSRTLSRTAAIFSADLAFRRHTDVG